VLVAGATGAIGAQLVPQLLARGHDVFGLTRSPHRRAAVRTLGARPLVADALDRDAVLRAVADAEPEIVVHELTALAGTIDMRHLDRHLAQTNRLRTEGTDHLLSAARQVGARRVVAQSFAGWPFARTGGPVKDESDPLDPDPPAALRETLAAIRYLERSVTTVDWAEGVVLRYGTFYGPGTAISGEPGAEVAEAVRRRRFPLVGDAGGVWSFVHVEDAAAATVMAAEHADSGIYHVVDDEPAFVRDWLPGLARALGAPAPRRVPRWLARLAMGEAATVWLTEARGASNRRARNELGWTPRFRSWRQGFGIHPFPQGERDA
jgi:nucleoside-diphosphate-sugar epimerase